MSRMGCRMPLASYYRYGSRQALRCSHAVLIMKQPDLHGGVCKITAKRKRNSQPQDIEQAEQWFANMLCFAERSNVIGHSWGMGRAPDKCARTNAYAEASLEVHSWRVWVTKVSLDQACRHLVQSAGENIIAPSIIFLASSAPHARHPSSQQGWPDYQANK